MIDPLLDSILTWINWDYFLLGFFGTMLIGFISSR